MRPILPFLLALSFACGSTDPEDCSSGEDEDEDGLVDCLDPDCWVEAAACAEDCDGAGDEDADGLADCLDDDCWVDGGTCTEVCVGSEDEDGDGAIDCADSDCWGEANRCGEDCDIAGDEDGDGAADCADDECWGSGCAEVCDGGEDEDGDGLTDCDDADCDRQAVCIESDCADDTDNDQDGLIDCEDADCVTDASCIETACDNSVDDDGDGLLDCQDDDCWGNGCDVVATRLLGASNVVFQRQRSLATGRDSCADLSYLYSEGALYAGNISGSATRYTTAGATSNCAFDVDELRVGWENAIIQNVPGQDDFDLLEVEQEWVEVVLSADCDFTFDLALALPTVDGIGDDAVFVGLQRLLGLEAGIGEGSMSVISRSQDTYTFDSGIVCPYTQERSEVLRYGNIISGDAIAVPTPPPAPVPL